MEFRSEATNNQLNIEDKHKVSNALFGLQAEIEKMPEGMDYNIYAERLWKKLGLKTDTPEFLAFKKDLISSMGKIRMDDLVHADLRDELLLEQLTDLPGELILWTKGDAEKTGYQKVKVARAKIYSAVKATLGRKHKTGNAIIAQNKIAEIGQYLNNKLCIKEGVDHIKPFQIVVLEDSVKAFEEIKKMVAKLGLESKVTVIPVWFNQTREGQTMKLSDEAKFYNHSLMLNGVKGFAELLKPELMNKIKPDENTIWLVDFDGVVADNVQMRERQLESKLSVIFRHTTIKDLHELSAVI